ncbi:MAG: hypothetical protein V9G24_12750 [Rhodoblastus sp.]
MDERRHAIAGYAEIAPNARAYPLREPVDPVAAALAIDDARTQDDGATVGMRRILGPCAHLSFAGDLAGCVGVQRADGLVALDHAPLARAIDRDRTEIDQAVRAAPGHRFQQGGALTRHGRDVAIGRVHDEADARQCVANLRRVVEIAGDRGRRGGIAQAGDRRESRPAESRNDRGADEAARAGDEDLVRHFGHCAAGRPVVMREAGRWDSKNAACRRANRASSAR